MNTPHLGYVSVAVGIMAMVSGCAYLTPTATTELQSESPETTSEVSSSLAASSEEPSGEATPATDGGLNDTSAATDAPTTTPPTTIPPPLGADELVLKSGGVGGALFGADPAGVIDYVSSILGSPTADTDWVDAAMLACPGTTVRRIDWGVLSLTFGDESDVSSGRAHLMAYTYGSIERFGGEPQGLLTDVALGLGATVAELREKYANVSIDSGDPDLDVPPSFFVEHDDAMVSGLLSGVDDTDVVLVIFGGSGCYG